MKVVLAQGNIRVAKGSAGLHTQVHGAMASVSHMAEAGGGISANGLMQTDTI